MIKSMLSDLRSVLDYSAQSIWESYTTKSSRLHFPYSEDEAKFRKSIKSNLNGLEQQKPVHSRKLKVFSLMHVVITGCLCSVVWQIPPSTIILASKLENSKAARTRVGEIADIGDGSRLIFEDCIFNGVLVGGNGKPLEISNARTVKQIQEDMKVPIEIHARVRVGKV